MKLTNKIHIIYLFIIGLITNACTEIIEVNINDAHPQIVVEAFIGNNQGAYASITKTVSLTDSFYFPPVKNAIVTITDIVGNTDVLNEIAPGQYYVATPTCIGVPGRSYTLSIETEEKKITSTSVIPNLVGIDSLKVLNSIYPGGGPPLNSNQPAPFYEITVSFTDPINEKNYYRFLVEINKKKTSTGNIMDDTYNNGKNVDNTLIVYNENLKKGDEFTVEMQCVDKNVYNYLKSMRNSGMGNPNASSPANPYTNLNGALLGFFNAHTSVKMTYKLP